MLYEKLKRNSTQKQKTGSPGEKDNIKAWSPCQQQCWSPSVQSLRSNSLPTKHQRRRGKPFRQKDQLSLSSGLGAVRGWLETEGRDTCAGLISYTDSQWGHRRMITLDHWVGRRIREWPSRFFPWVQNSSLGHRTPPCGTKVMPLLSAQATEAAGMDAILIQLFDGHSIGINRKYVCPHHKALVGQNRGEGWQWVGWAQQSSFYVCL